ncbi:hypothetical protein BDD12DRAFT_840907, partial [Trichophaea hybrida]
MALSKSKKKRTRNAAHHPSHHTAQKTKKKGTGNAKDIQKQNTRKTDYLPERPVALRPQMSHVHTIIRVTKALPI